MTCLRHVRAATNQGALRAANRIPPSPPKEDGIAHRAIPSFFCALGGFEERAVRGPCIIDQSSHGNMYSAFLSLDFRSALREASV